MKRVLILSNVITMISQFNRNNIQILQKLGYEVHVGCNLENTSFSPKKQNEIYIREFENQGVMFHQVDFGRRFSAYRTIGKACKQIKEILKEGNFEFVHCHSQIAGLCGRIVAHKMKVKSIYTAHGFMFYKGAPILNWLLFYPQEWIMAWHTNLLITINKEDYRVAQKHMHAKRVVYIPGVGVEIEKFVTREVDIKTIRESLGLHGSDIMLLSVGELSTRKNQELIIKALAKLNNERLKYFICGQGEKETEFLSLLEELGLQNRVKLLGYRTDVVQLCQAADVFAFPSLQEGLSVALMEAIATKTAVICSRIRGNTDLVIDENYLFDPTSVNELCDALEYVTTADNTEVIEKNYERLSQCDIYNVNKMIEQQYKEI